MGLLQNFAEKRIAKIDRARVGLFGLSGDEFPVETQALNFVSLWPTVMGLPMEPEDAAKLPMALMDGMEMTVPFVSVGLLTSTHFRWTPIRSYRGKEVFRDPMHSYLAGGSKANKRAIYTLFEHPLLGPRAIPISRIKRVTLDIYQPSEFAVMSMHLTDSFDLEPDLPWPRYVVTHDTDPGVAVGIWEAGSNNQRHIVMYHEGISVANVATAWLDGFEYLEIPFQTEYLLEDALTSWQQWREMQPKERWRTLNQRLID